MGSSWAESLVGFPSACDLNISTYNYADLCSVNVGLAAGAASASRSISSDSESRQRIETAFRRFRADLLRKEADELDKGRSVWDKMF